jgi:hypothetical protein
MVLQRLFFAHTFENEKKAALGGLLKRR